MSSSTWVLPYGTAKLFHDELMGIEDSLVHHFAKTVSKMALFRSVEGAIFDSLERLPGDHWFVHVVSVAADEATDIDFIAVRYRKGEDLFTISSSLLAEMSIHMRSGAE